MSVCHQRERPVEVLARLPTLTVQSDDRLVEPWPCPVPFTSLFFSSELLLVTVFRLRALRLTRNDPDSYQSIA